MYVHKRTKNKKNILLWDKKIILLIIKPHTHTKKDFSNYINIYALMHLTKAVKCQKFQ